MNDQEKFTTQSSKLHRAKFQLLKTLIVQHKHRYVAIVCLFLSVMYVFCFCFVTNLRVCLDHNSNTMMVISIYFLFYYFNFWLPRIGSFNLSIGDKQSRDYFWTYTPFLLQFARNSPIFLLYEFLMSLLLLLVPNYQLRFGFVFLFSPSITLLW